MSDIQSEQCLIITAVGPDTHNMLSRLTKSVATAGCHIIESKIQKIGQDIAMFFSVKGTWHGVAKLEAKLPAFAKKAELEIQSRRTHYPIPDFGLPYAVSITCEDKPKVVSEILGLFEKLDIEIDEFSHETYVPPKTSTQVCSIQMRVKLPQNSQIANLREQFYLYCEDADLDASLEPFKIHP